jgi:heterogeneous nuclear ribonucleoprotein L
VKENTNGRPQPLLQEPHYGSRPQPYNPYPSEQQRYDEMCAGPGYGEPFGTETYRKSAPPVTAEYRDQRNTHFQQPGAVLMVYGLDPLRTNADKLFNLMCLYGNVARVSVGECSPRKYFVRCYVIREGLLRKDCLSPSPCRINLSSRW